MAGFEETASLILNTQDLLLGGLELGVGQDSRFMQRTKLLQLRKALIR